MAYKALKKYRLLCLPLHADAMYQILGSSMLDPQAHRRRGTEADSGTHAVTRSSATGIRGLPLLPSRP